MTNTYIMRSNGKTDDTVKNHIKSNGAKLKEKGFGIDIYTIEADSDTIHKLKGKGYKPERIYNKI